MKTAVLDSYALIAYLEGQEGHDEVARLFDECTAKNRKVFMCIVNWGEVVYHAMLKGGDKIANLAQDTIRALPIELVDANKDLTLQAAIIKSSTKMSYADCFAAALVMKIKSELVTGEKNFKQMEDKIKLRWIR